MKIHYLQHVSFENPGMILNWAEKKGHQITSTRLFLDESLPKQEEFDWLIIMGGPMNIYEEEEHPWLIREKKFIKEAIHLGKTVLGICLGAQLIADVIGGSVHKNPVKEIGWFSVNLSDNITQHELFSGFPKNPIVFEWHGDTFDELPDEALCIATNEACEHQAFIYHERVFGFQFHLENTEEIIQNLVMFCEEELDEGKYVQTKEQIIRRADLIEINNKYMQLFLDGLEKMSLEVV